MILLRAVSVVFRNDMAPPGCVDYFLEAGFLICLLEKKSKIVSIGSIALNTDVHIEL